MRTYSHTGFLIRREKDPSSVHRGVDIWRERKPGASQGEGPATVPPLMAFRGNQPPGSLILDFWPLKL